MNIIDPISHNKHSIYSVKGKYTLKQYIKHFNTQYGGSDGGSEDSQPLPQPLPQPQPLPLPQPQPQPQPQPIDTGLLHNGIGLPENSGSKPIFMITLGPTGSGKGSALPEAVINKLNIKNIKTSDFVQILVDDLVENSKQYKKQVTDIISKTCDDKFELCEKLTKNIENLELNLVEKIGTAYFTSRKQGTCKQDKDTTDDNDIESIDTCDKVNDAKLKRALEEKKHIIFESVGTYVPNWIFDVYKEQLKNYVVVFAWSVVAVEELIKRNKSRAIGQFEQFIKNSKSPAPRLPDVRKAKYVETIKSIIEAFTGFMDKMVTNNLGIETRAMIINNNKRDTQVVYDSATCDATELGCVIEDIKNKILQETYDVVEETSAVVEETSDL
jgi:hypothetical protein